MAPNLLPALAIMLLQSSPPSTPPRQAWILECGMPNREGQPGPRTFRLGRQLFEEWRPDEKRFGGNLCLVFQCRAEAGQYEGVISSASLILKVRAAPETGLATWSTVGASGYAKTSGVCRMRPDTSMEKESSGE